MTTPATAIKDEVHLLMDVQIETLRQPIPITFSQLREYDSRSEEATDALARTSRLTSCWLASIVL